MIREAGSEKRNCEKENGEEKTNSSVLLPASVVMCVSVPCIATNFLMESTKLHLETSKLGPDKMPGSLESSEKKPV